MGSQLYIIIMNTSVVVNVTMILRYIQAIRKDDYNDKSDGNF